MRQRGVGLLAAVLLLAACTSSGPAHDPSTSATGGSPGSSTSARSSAQVPPTDPDHPNVVLVVADDLSWNLVPFLRQLGQMQLRGLTMDHYFTNDPLGSPARATILTGRYPHNTGVLTNKDAAAAFTADGEDRKTIAVAARRIGYQTGYFGEYLTGYTPDDPAAPGWDRWAVTDNGFDGFGYTLRQNSTTRKYGTSAGDYITDVLGDRATSFIRSAAAQGTPFLAQVSTFAPHLPAVPAPRDAHAFPTTTYPRTRSFDRAVTDPPSWLRFGALTTPQTTAIDAQFRLRLRAAQAIDTLIARIESALETAQVAQNTYLVFTSTNGYHLGEYRLPAGKRTAFDIDTRVPLFVTGPAVRAGRHAGQYASTVDLAPTIARLIGATLPEAPDGVSLDQVWHGVKASVQPSAVLIEHRQGRTFTGDPDRHEAAAGNPPDYVAIRTPTGLFVRYSKAKEKEYYNVVTDPDELDNLGPSGRVLRVLQRALTALATCRGPSACKAAAKIAR